MNKNSSDKSENNEDNWSYGKSIAKLDSSDNNMSEERKEIIRRVLGFDILDIRSYAGYKGDLLIEITTLNPTVAKSIENIVQDLCIETVIQKDILSIYKVFCITESSSGYELKD